MLQGIVSSLSQGLSGPLGSGRAGSRGRRSAEPRAQPSPAATEAQQGASRGYKISI